MGVERATTLVLIRNTNFDDTYEDVILFNDEEEQFNYFSGLSSIHFSEYSYQRPEANYVKVNCDYGSACECTYMMFRNYSHEDRWWYAFIDSVEYINEKTTGVKFHIDVMQSYMFSYELGESFVVREHPKTDNPGDNLVPEGIYYGDYQFTSTTQLSVDGTKCPFGINAKLTPEDMCIVIAYNPGFLVDLLNIGDVSDYIWKENLYGGVYQGLRFLCMPYTEKMGEGAIEFITSKLDALFGSANILTQGGIVGIYMMPIIFLPPRDGVTHTNIRHGMIYDAPTSFPGFTPKNKKLLTYPYVTINVSNMRDQGVDYAYEYFNNRKASFYYEGTLSLNPSCICYPVGYKGRSMAVEDGVSIAGYPLVSWGQDGITEWLSNHMFQTAIGVTASAVGAYQGAIGDPIGALQSINPSMTLADARRFTYESRVGTDIVTTRHAEKASNEAVVKSGIGAVGEMITSPPSPSCMNGHDLLFGNTVGKMIRIRRKSILPENARRIDDYFTRYGYATNELKVPELNTRPFWNYIKLKAPHFDNIRCPMDVVNKIASVYEKGVTFWRHNAIIGDYTNQDNSV